MISSQHWHPDFWPPKGRLSLSQQLLGNATAYPLLLLLEESQLLLVHSRGEGVDLGQLGFGAHELLHGVSGHSPLDGSVDPPHCLEHCRGGQQEATQAEWSCSPSCPYQPGSAGTSKGNGSVTLLESHSTGFKLHS